MDSICNRDLVECFKIYCGWLKLASSRVLRFSAGRSDLCIFKKIASLRNTRNDSYKIILNENNLIGINTEH